MTRGKKFGFVVAGIAIGAGAVMLASPRAQFLTGGALVNAGFLMQDHLHAYDLEHEHDATPEQVWKEFLVQNELAAQVREKFPRSTEHPVMALLVCMDARIDTAELAGDTRHYYYVVRTAGSVMGPQESDMLELAVANGVKVVVLTRHSDCAAEKVAADPVKRAQFPSLSEAVDKRSEHVAAFLKRPLIAEKVAKGELMVKEMFIDTANEHLIEGNPPQSAIMPVPDADAHAAH